MILLEISISEKTTIIFESPHRLKKLLLELKDFCGGEREIQIFRELTKKYEENIGSNVNTIIDFFTDTTPEKINKFMPGKKINIVKYKKNILNNVDYAFLGAWNFKKEIFKKEKKFLRKGGKFITHIPNPKIIKL